MKNLLLVCLCLPCTACGLGPEKTAPIAQASPDLVGEPFDQVLLRVKQEIGLYQAQSANWRQQLKQDFAQFGIKPVCGSGDINFQIKSVKMEFETVVGRTKTGELGLKIPFGPAGAGSIGPNLSGSSDFTGTNTLDYTYYAPERIGAIDPEATRTIEESAVIAPTLTALRKGLIRATAHLPCMTDTPKDRNGTFTFAVELKKNLNPKIGFNFYVVSANIGENILRKRINTITVTFHPTPTGGAAIF